MPDNHDILSCAQRIVVIAMRWLAGVVLVLGCAAAQAAAPDEERKSSRLNPMSHATTGFALSGAHIRVRCESCHVQGVFKGTPRNCNACHVSGNRMGASTKTANHIPTTASCDSCHRTGSWTPAIFNHGSVAPGTCNSCHNGTTAQGKNSGHTPTTASCDTCHKTTAWTPATTKHNNVAPGTCATCHNGTTAQGKNSGHTPTAASCDTCHRTTAWTPATMNHSNVAPGSCNGCHNGTSATGKPSNHIPEAQLGAGMTCDACHTSKTSWSTIRMNHNGSTGNGIGWCKACHDKGVSYLGNMEKKSLGHKAKGGVVPTDCSMSGCHRPLGNKGSAYSAWD